MPLEPNREQLYVLKDLAYGKEILHDHNRHTFFREDLVPMEDEDLLALKKAGFLTWGEEPSSAVRLTPHGEAYLAVREERA